ncbi:MAG TPA: hypothetical protein PLB34_13455, partial [Rhodoblastus sp.]|nr:hypothetical protein [Rhodoblastus sp.]
VRNVIYVTNVVIVYRYDHMLSIFDHYILLFVSMTSLIEQSDGHIRMFTYNEPARHASLPQVRESFWSHLKSGWRRPIIPALRTKAFGATAFRPVGQIQGLPIRDIRASRY